MPFVTGHLEIFHCAHHPLIPKFDVYFVFCSTLIHCLKEHQMDYPIALGNGMNPNTPLNGCEINVCFCFA